MARDRLNLDYETYSDVSLPDVGTSVYAQHPSTEVLMAAYAINRSAVNQWVPAEGEPIPRELAEALIDPEVEKWAWHAPFEMAITDNLVAEVKIEQWRDTMVQALHCSLPGALAKAAEVVGLPVEMQKDRRGKALMRKFSFPRKPTARDKSTRKYWHDLPEDWEGYKQYNRSDVVAERGVLIKLEPYIMSAEEWELWHLDQKINQAGLPINTRMVRNAIRIYEEALEISFARMRELSGLANPNSLKQLLPWLQEHGYMFDDCTKANIKTAASYFKEQPDHWTERQWEGYRHNEALREILELRLETSRTSIKKYYALERATDDDGRLRGTLQMNGAARTGRWAGRIFQPQNLPRPEKKFEDIQPLIADDIEHMDYESMVLLYGNVFDVLASGLRPAAQAPEGRMFIDADLSAIENRVLGWLSGCDKILDVFRNGLDPYIAFATYLYDTPYADLWHEYKVERNGDKRTIAKPGTLGCPRGDTLVLTNRGWVRLDKVRNTDLVHDGVEWVKHEGVVNQGEQPCEILSGVVITGDHKVWQGGSEWMEVQEQDSHSWKQAIGAAVSSLCASLETDLLLGRYISAAAIADARSNSAELASWPRTGRNGGATTVPGEHPDVAEIASGKTFTTDSPIGSMRLDAVAQTLEIPGFGFMADGGSSVVSRLPISLSGSALMNSVLMAHLRSTEKTMTGTMNPETSDLGTEACKTAIGGIATKSNTGAGGIPPPSSEDCSRQDTATAEQLPEKQTLDSVPKRSLPISQNAGVHTVFDIVNAGPRNRFVILSADGPCVIHNCGYGMGAGQKTINRKTGEIEGTGLLGYAWGMGVTSFTPEDAKHSVDTFRREFSEVKDYWYAMERAMRRCIKTGKTTAHGVSGGPEVRFEMDGPFCKMILPSGRPLYYLRPKIELIDTPWGDKRMQITYEGLNDRKQWVRMHTTPGKITENADQAISRDLLVHGMKKAARRGLDIRLHVHDQIVGVSLEDKASKDLDTLIECMSESPWWGDGLPLGANGLTAKVFLKD